MASPAAMLRSLGAASTSIQRTAAMLPVRASYVRLAARCDSCVKTVDAALQAVNNTLSAQAQDELSRAVMKLAGILSGVQKLLALVQQRNVVGNLANLDSDASETVGYSLSIRDVQLECLSPLYRTTSPSTADTDLSLSAQALDANHQLLREAVVQDRLRWETIAENRLQGANENHENLAVMLNIRPEELPAQIASLKGIVRGMSDGPVKKFLNKALSDYRIMNNLSHFAGSQFEIDLAFMVDCTSSMGIYIAYVKDVIRDMLLELRKNYPHVRVRMGFVGYTDFDDAGRPTYYIADFNEPNAVTAQIETVQAKGGFGSDFAEDVLGGLREVIKLSWNSSVRILIHVGDAPPHGKRFRDSGENHDRYYYDDDVDPNGIAPIHYRDILTELMTIRKVRNYCFMHLDRYTTGTEQLFAEHIATIKEAVFQVVSMDQGKNKPDYQVFLQAVLKQTGQSIYNSVAFDTRQLPPDA